MSKQPRDHTSQDDASQDDVCSGAASQDPAPSGLASSGLASSGLTSSGLTSSGLTSSGLTSSGLTSSGDFSLGTVQVASSPQERFTEYLQSKGKRITQQRRILVEHVFKRHDHFDAEELILNLALQEDGRKVSRPTVYRTLNELVESGLLRRMMLSGRAIYEHDYGYPQHDHLHCTVCNQLIEFHSADLQKIRDAVARDYKFHMTGHRLIINGICQECSCKQQR
jgi:Fur family ferric uptake transcriptional regulator